MKNFRNHKNVAPNSFPLKIDQNYKGFAADFGGTVFWTHVQKSVGKSSPLDILCCTRNIIIANRDILLVGVSVCVAVSDFVHHLSIILFFFRKY